MNDRRLSDIEESLTRELQALLGGTLFSGYTDRARFRSDDLAVRNAASRSVLEAKSRAENLIDAWASDTIPEPSREMPFPEPGVTRKLRVLRGFANELGELESAIRSAEAPDFDDAWNSKRDGSSVLAELLAVDKELLVRSRALAEQTLSIAKTDLFADEPFAALQPAISDVGSILRHRKTITAA